MNFFQELKRRNVIRVGIAYVLGAWVLLQIVDFALEVIAAPDWILQVFFLAAVLGLVIALVVAWIFEVTPDGIKRESQIDRSESVAPETGRKLDRAIIVFLSLAVVLLLVERFTGETNQPESPATAEAVMEPTESTAASEPVTIAVLPFVNMSSDEEQEYFSDGITEEILNRLAGIRDLQVAARTSVFSFKGQNQDIREIARTLGVSNILEGSVRKAGDQVRITAQLIRAEDGFHLWSDAYDRKLENIFAIQDDIASQIADALQVSLGISTMQASRPVVPQVYDLYLRARTLHRQRGSGVAQAIELFEQALAIDEGFAPAWAGLAHSYIVVLNYVSPEAGRQLGDVGAKSMAAAQRALELDPNLPTALHAMANNLLFRYEWKQAEEHYQRALQLDPDSADIMEDYLSMLTFSWQFERALEVGHRMIELDPQVPIFLLMLSTVHHAIGDFEQRDILTDRGLEIGPTMGNLQEWKLFSLLQNEQYEEARGFAMQMNAETRNTEASLMSANWLAGDRLEISTEVIEALGEFPPLLVLAERFDQWFVVMETFGAEWSEWAISRSIDLVAPVASAEQMKQFRSDPRSTAWLEGLRLPEYWREVGWPAPCRPLGDEDFICE